MKDKAGVAQLVERNLAKVEVESSRLFSRSRIPRRLSLLLLMRHITRRLSSSTLSSGEVAKRLCSGLQSRLDGFDSRPRLQNQDNRRLMPGDCHFWAHFFQLSQCVLSGRFARGRHKYRYGLGSRRQWPTLPCLAIAAYWMRTLSAMAAHFTATTATA